MWMSQFQATFLDMEHDDLVAGCGRLDSAVEIRSGREDGAWMIYCLPRVPPLAFEIRSRLIEILPNVKLKLVILRDPEITADKGPH